MKESVRSKPSTHTYSRRNTFTNNQCTQSALRLQEALLICRFRGWENHLEARFIQAYSHHQEPKSCKPVTWDQSRSPRFGSHVSVLGTLAPGTVFTQERAESLQYCSSSAYLAWPQVPPGQAISVHYSLSRHTFHKRKLLWIIIMFMRFPKWLSGNITCLPVQETQDTWVWSLGQEDPLAEEMATCPSILAWRILWTEEPGGLQSVGLQRVGHDWVSMYIMLEFLLLIKVRLSLCRLPEWVFWLKVGNQLSTGAFGIYHFN